MADQLFGVAELGFYRRVFDAAELEGEFLGGAKGAELLAKSNLPRKTLHEIWNVADARNEGRLDFSAFCVACRLAAHAQQGLPVSAESVNQDPVAPLQLFGSARPTPTTSPKMASSSSSTGQQANIDWRPSDGELQQYLQVFRGLQLEQAGAIAGSQAPQGYLEKGEPVRQLFAKAGVSPLELDALWSLADADGDGLLSVKEFCVAMNLITKCQKQKTAIPVEIPTDATNFSLPASSPTHQGMKDVERAKLSHRMDELQMSHEFLRAQIEAVENDLLLLSELHPNVRSSPQEPPSASENQSFEEFRTKALQTVRIDREMARIDNQKIEELRVKLKSMDREKKSLGQKNAVLLEKFRQIEQDRSLLMASVDTERSKLLLLREERLKLMNERCQLKATEAKLNQELASKPTYLQQAKPQNDLMSFGSLEQVGPAKQWQAFGNSGTAAAAGGGNAGVVAGAATNTSVDWTSNFNGPTKWESFKN
eukprot:g6118.t1